jgi:polar amino acid transport system substrate-binding protein
VCALLALAGCAREPKTIETPDDARSATIGVMTGTTGEAQVRRRHPDAAIRSVHDVMDAVAALKADKIEAAVTARATPPPLRRLDGGRICVLSGSAGDIAARREFPSSDFLVMETSADAAIAVAAGKADAFVYDKSVLLNIERQNPALGIIAEPVSALEVAAAIAKGNTPLLAELNRGIDELEQEGVLARLREKWIDTPYRQVPPPETVETNGKGGVLVMGTSATLEPFSFLANGTATGMDIDLGKALAARLDKRLKIIDMNFGSLIPALQSGKIDFALSNFNVTEERKKLVAFSRPYIRNDISALVRRSELPTPDVPHSGAPSGNRSGNSSIGTFMDGIAGSFRSNFIEEGRWRLVLDGLRVTVVISVLSTLFGTAVGGVACFMRMSRNKGLELMARVYIALLRGTPVLVLLMLIFYVLFASVDIDPILVAVFAFGLNFGAYASEIFRSGIEGVGRGQFEAGIASGFTKAGTFLNIILPQAVLRILPVYKGEFISLVKMTSIVGYIAVQDLTKASDIIRSRTFDAFFPLVMVAILYFLISGLLMQSFGWLEHLLGRPAAGHNQPST